MNLTEKAVEGAVILFCIFVVIAAGLRIIEVWISEASIGGSITETLVWLFLASAFVMYIAEIRDGLKDGC